MKPLIVFSILFLSYNITRAQTSSADNRDQFQFGLKVGFNYSNVYDSQGEQFNADPKFGMMGGAVFAIPIGKIIGIQPEVLISQKGFKANGIILGSEYSFTRTTTYLDIPLQFALKPSKFFTLLLGPEYSYLMHQRDVFANATTSIAQEQEFKNENIRKNIFGFVGGFDVNIDHFLIAAKLGWDATKNNGDGTSSTPRYKNVWYQLAIGFKF